MSTKQGDSKNAPMIGGALRQMAETHVVETGPRAGRRRGVLVVSSGLDAGRVLSIPAGDLVTLGRAPDCTFPLDDVSLSREHARIVVVGTEHVFKDAGSRNGSYVNDVKVTAATQLRDGDRVQLGSDTMLRFSLVDDDEEQALRRVYNAAIRDGLTGVFNRKHLEERLDAELAYSLRHGTPLSVAIADVDHFKKVNDTFGHLAGDAVLKMVAALLAQALRTEDVLARYGGEEFVIVARGLDAQHAVYMAERARAAVAQTPITYDGQSIRVTVSAGVASLECCGERRDRAALLGLADGRLYQAKQGGRNRVIGPS
jgi:diguanylate cyclase (GGDEF)-like protein